MYTVSATTPKQTAQVLDLKNPRDVALAIVNYTQPIKDPESPDFYLKLPDLWWILGQLSEESNLDPNTLPEDFRLRVTPKLGGIHFSAYCYARAIMVEAINGIDDSEANYWSNLADLLAKGATTADLPEEFFLLIPRGLDHKFIAAFCCLQADNYHGGRSNQCIGDAFMNGLTRSMLPQELFDGIPTGDGAHMAAYFYSAEVRFNDRGYPAWIRLINAVREGASAKDLDPAFLRDFEIDKATGKDKLITTCLEAAIKYGHGEVQQRELLQNLLEDHKRMTNTMAYLLQSVSTHSVQHDDAGAPTIPPTPALVTTPHAHPPMAAAASSSTSAAPHHATTPAIVPPVRVSNCPQALFPDEANRTQNSGSPLAPSSEPSQSHGTKRPLDLDGEGNGTTDGPALKK